MSVFGKKIKCAEICETCDKKCVLHRKHLNNHYCESFDCALELIETKCLKCNQNYLIKDEHNCLI